MIPGLHEAGLSLLEAAAERRAAAAAAGDTSTKNAAVFQPSSFDRLLLPEGMKFTPALLSRWLQGAAIGQTPDLFAFYGEMKARDAHLDSEITTQTDYVTSAILDAAPYPIATSKVKGGRITGEAKTAEDVASFLAARYSSPEYHLEECLKSLMDGEAMGVGGYQTVSEPDPAPGSFERIKENTPLPPQRFWYDTLSTRLLFQTTGTYLPQIPVEELGPKGSAVLVVHQVDLNEPSPARRGYLRRCLNYWLIKQRGLVWWAQFVQNYGSPALMGFFDIGADNAKAVLEKAFKEFGNNAKMILPKGTSVEALNVAMQLGRETPHERISDWCDRQNSRIVSGHDQSSGVQVDAGSKQSTETADEKGRRRAQARAKRIAQTLREWDAKPAVSREFGPEIAERFTSVITLKVESPKDLVGLSEAFKNFADANVETIPVQEFHNLTGIRTPEEGEPCITPKAAAPAALPFGRPAPAEDPASAEDQQAAALARILPFARAAVKAAQAEETDLAALQAKLLKKATAAAKDSGEEIVAPYRDLIVASVKEGATLQQIVVRVLHRATEQLEAPELEDLLAATIAEAMCRGLELEQKAAGR